MNIEKDILAHVELVSTMTATFFKALIEKGVPVEAATTLTSGYIYTMLSINKPKEFPKNPWE